MMNTRLPFTLVQTVETPNRCAPAASSRAAGERWRRPAPALNVLEPRAHRDGILPAMKKPRCAGLFACARVDSNHHGEISPQGPQPRTRAKDASAGVQIVQIARIRGRSGRIWTGD